MFSKTQNLQAAVIIKPKNHPTLFKTQKELGCFLNIMNLRFSEDVRVSKSKFYISRVKCNFQEASLKTSRV